LYKGIWSYVTSDFYRVARCFVIAGLECFIHNLFVGTLIIYPQIKFRVPGYNQ